MAGGMPMARAAPQRRSAPDPPDHNAPAPPSPGVGALSYVQVPLPVMRKPPTRKLVDWTPDAGPVEDWLERWTKAGYVPEYGRGVETSIGGREVTRWAMIRAESAGNDSEGPDKA